GLAALQWQVARAWANPADPDSKYAIVLFNRGPRLLPEPPRLGVMTRLNPLPSYLFVSSLLTYVFTRDDAQFNSPARVCRGLYSQRAEQITDQFDLLWWQGEQFFATSLVGVGIGVLSLSGVNRTVATLSTFARLGIGAGGAFAVYNQLAAAGVMLDRLGQMTELLAADAMVPEPPRMRAAELVLGPRGEEQVRVRFDRSGSEHAGASSQFVYTLYRFEPSSNDRIVVAARR